MKEEKHPILWWYNYFPTDIREKAIENYKVWIEASPARQYVKEFSLELALLNGFQWSKAREGRSYWEIVQRYVKAGEYKIRYEYPTPMEELIKELEILENKLK